MRFIDYTTIINLAWNAFNAHKHIAKIEDISARVSTNYVYRVSFTSGGCIIAKLSQFGTHEHFVDDHKIINALANNLLYPFDQFLARSLNKNNQIFTYRYRELDIDVWTVFYNPIRIDQKLPKILEADQITKLAEQMAFFHKTSSEILDELPTSAKTMETDILDFKALLETQQGKFNYGYHTGQILQQCDLFLENSKKLGYAHFEKLPVFVDWNIGNFSVDENLNFYSRWDYDWFRMSPRVMDFYFWARVVRAEGDQTTFSYLPDPFMEDRFLLFLKAYHRVYPLTKAEILFIKEAYRFFILHYVVRLGNYFFLSHFAEKLVNEAFAVYFPEIDAFNAELLWQHLNQSE